MSKSPRRLRLGVAMAVVATAALAACSSPSEVSSESESSSASSGSAGGGSDEAQAALQAAYEGEMGTPPTEPTTPPEDVNVWVVSCGEAVPSCAAPTAATVEAAEVVGWTANTCDGALNPDGWGRCVRQAVSADADVIIPIGIDCASIEQAFREARDADVTVVGGGGTDCNRTGGEALWASEVLQLEGYEPEQAWNFVGELAADWLIGQTDGQAKALAMEFTDPVWGPWIQDGFEARMSECADCEILETVPFGNADIGPNLGQKFSTALLANPDANAVFVPVGGLMLGGLAQAVEASGRSDDMAVITGLGVTPNLDLIRSGTGQDAIVGYPIEWGGWASIDTAIRVLNGEEPLVQGNGYQVVDAENNMPAAGEPFTGGEDYQAAYREAWGV